MEPYRPNCYKIPELNGLRVLLVFIVSWYHAGLPKRMISIPAQRCPMW